MNELIVIGLCFSFPFLIVGFIAIGGFLHHFFKKKMPKEKIAAEKISIIIPFRNDIKYIYSCIKSLSHEDLPIGEMIIVNDHGEDADLNSEIQKILSTFKSVKLINNADGCTGKRSALETGISVARNEKILISDADCTWTKEALAAMLFCENKNKKNRLILSTVVYRHGTGFFDSYLQAELFLLNSYGGGYALINQSFLASGAAMLFYKTDFIQYLSKTRYQQINSGDDVFFMEYIQEKYGKQSIAHVYGSQAVVETVAPDSWLSYIRQRSRWGKKTPRLKNPVAIVIALSTALFSTSIMVWAAAIVVHYSAVYYLVWVLVLKLLIENTIMLLSSVALGRKTNFLFTTLVSLLSPLFFYLVAARMIFIRDQWQGRDYLNKKKRGVSAEIE